MANFGTVRPVDADYECEANDQTLLVDATAANVQITLPVDNAEPGRIIIIIKNDASANTVTPVAPAGYGIVTTEDPVLSLQGEVEVFELGREPVWYQVTEVSGASANSVRLQALTPGAEQTGNTNISGVMKALDFFSKTTGFVNKEAFLNAFGITAYDSPQGGQYGAVTSSMFETGNAANGNYGQYSGVGMSVQPVPPLIAGSMLYSGNAEKWTVIGKLETEAPDVDGSGFVLPHGAAPAAPNDGDFWTETTGVFVRLDGETFGLVKLQAGTPGDIQVGHTNITGASRAASYTSLNLLNSSSMDSNGLEITNTAVHVTASPAAGVTVETVGEADSGFQMMNDKIKAFGTKVIGGQQPAIADATGAGDVVAQLNLLLAAMRTHGLIAT